MSQDAEKASVTVRIAGEEHTIRANAEPDYTRRCAELVDRRMRKIRSQAGLIETHKAAILAALSITDEFFQARDRLEEYRREVAARLDDLTERLEEALDEAPEAASGRDD